MIGTHFKNFFIGGLLIQSAVCQPVAPEKRDLLAVVGNVTKVIDGALTDVGIVVDGVTKLVGGVGTDVVDIVDGLLQNRDVNQKRQVAEKRDLLAVVNNVTKVIDGALTDVGIIVDGATSLVGGVGTDVVEIIGELLDERDLQEKRELNEKRDLIAVVNNVTKVIDGALTDVGIVVDGVTKLVGGIGTDVVLIVDGLLDKRDAVTAAPLVKETNNAFRLFSFNNGFSGMLFGQIFCVLALALFFY